MSRIGAVVNKMMQIDGERIISQGLLMNKKLLERLLLMKYTFELNISLIFKCKSKFSRPLPTPSKTMVSRRLWFLTYGCYYYDYDNISR